MGHEGVTIAVADAGPLIHLGEIGHLDLLAVFSQIHMPEAVWNETVTCGRVSGEQLLSSVNVHRHTLSDNDVAKLAAQQASMESLHRGELECLVLCQRLKGPILLTDDLAVRRVVGQLGTHGVGSLGVVVRAYRLGRIDLPGAEHVLRELNDISSLFVTAAIVDMAIAQLRSWR